MKSPFQLQCIFAAVLSLGAAQAVHAQDSGYYFGLGAGATGAKVDEARISAALLANGASSVSIVPDNRSFGLKLFGGYQINKDWAVEAGYFNLGRFGYAATTTPAGTLDGDIKLQGVNLDLVGQWPLTQRWSALGRVGAQVARAQDRFRATGAVNITNTNPSKTDLNLKLGVGLQYEWSPSLLLRTEIERYRINDAVGNKGDINKLSVSMVFPFGRKESAPVAAAPAPAPAPVIARPVERIAPAPVPAPAPPPVVVAQTPPPPAPAVAVQKVSLAADSLFDFDQSTLTSNGLQAMAQFSGQLKGLKIDSMTINGHTDRLGSVAHNEKLSLRRAQTVKQYLVDQAGVAADKVAVSGKGSTAPVTKAADCKGSKPTARLIACLQPDRRVDIQATGTR
jgi:OmpA-OmpF porin, OOP family